jgi:hypothetical protein
MSRLGFPLDEIAKLVGGANVDAVAHYVHDVIIANADAHCLTAGAAIERPWMS